MNIWGMVFMALSWGTIIFLMVYSFGRILSGWGDNNRR